MDIKWIDQILQDTAYVHTGGSPEELKEAMESEEEDAEYDVSAYARVGDSPIVYQIASLNYANLTAASYNDLRHKELITASFDDVIKIDIMLDGEEYTFTADGEGDEKTWQDSEGEEVDIYSIRSAITNLQADSPEDFTDETPSGKEEISFTLYYDNEQYPEIHAALYRYDGQDCLAVLEGETLAKIARQYVVNLTEAVYAIVLG